MSKKKEPSDYQDESPDSQVDDWADTKIFLNFVEKKYSDQRLFSALDFYNEWQNESTDAPPLIIIEQKLNKLAEEQKIDKIVTLEPQDLSMSNEDDKKETDSTTNDDNEGNNDNDNGEKQPINSTKQYGYIYVIKYKYITPKPQIEMAEAFYKIKNEMLKSPITIIALSEKLNINHQKIRSIIDVLTCLDIIKPTSKGGTCIWDQFQENRIRNVKNIYPQLVQAKKKELLKE